ncbi:MAG: tetratricopeptide repeat protein [Candidatus Krumholzibacteria bacterium]|nr:tetratricopeptide repeat protein [Candidatus Krumholzibacteria bacterium]
MTDDISAEIKHLKAKYDQAPQSRLFAPLADAYRKNGQVDRAIELCEAGLTRYPDYASAHVILGKCFYDKGATERSRAEFERVIELDGENMVALKYMGDILLAEGKRDAAVSYLRRLLAIDPTNEEAAAMLEGLEEEFQGKEIDLSAAKGPAPAGRTDEVATMTLAGIYAAQGYYSKALKIYQDIVGSQPHNVEAKRMIEKIERLVESSDREREETFDGDVMTISIEDVSDDLAASTAGRGTGGAAGSGGDAEEPGRSLDEGPEITPFGEGPSTDAVLGDEDDLEQVARELEEADSSLDSAVEAKEAADTQGEPDRVTGAAREGMDNFRKWLKKMQENDAGAPEDDS